MTLIEFFSSSHVDNIAASLRLQPEKLIMVGDADEMSVPVKRYQKLLSQRGLRTKISTCNVQEKDFGEICAVLRKLVDQEPDCVIDLTGGDELTIMAVGAAVSNLDQNARNRIRVERFDHEKDCVVDCIHGNQNLSCKPANLTVEELIAIHGGSLHPDSYQPPMDFTHRDLDTLWDLVSDAPKEWNSALMILGEFESRSDSKTEIYLPLRYLHNSISDFDRKEGIVRDLLDKLQRRGIIDDRSSRDVLEYTYLDPVQRYCIQKAGNVLEIKTLLEGRSVLEDGRPFFHDCRMSVSIDWDGVVHKSYEKEPETRNEIDVILMHGTTPLFISCKNGTIADDEPYKLDTVAARFGGPYVKKMLVAADPTAVNRALGQRIQDMGIRPVTNVTEMSHAEWRQTLIQAIR